MIQVNTQINNIELVWQYFHYSENVTTKRNEYEYPKEYPYRVRFIKLNDVFVKDQLYLCNCKTSSSKHMEKMNSS